MFPNQLSKFELGCPDGETLTNAFEGVEEALGGLDDPENSLFHLYFDGESRSINGKMEVKLDDGTYYPLQERMEHMD